MIRVLTLGLLALASAVAQGDVARIEKWRVQAGDDPRWASPDFDDSAWEASSWPRRHTTAQPFFAGTRWYRATASVPASIAGRPLAVAVGPLDEVYDVFVDGVRIGTHGSWEPTPAGKFPTPRWFPIPETAAKGPLLHIAIRRWTGSTRTNYRSLNSSGTLQAPHAPEIGPADVIGLQQELRRASGLNAHMVSLMVYTLTLLAGLLSLALYVARQGSHENWWLGLALICEAVAPLAGFTVSQSDLPVRAPLAIVIVGLQFLAAAVWPCFLASISPRFSRPLRWLAAVNGLIAIGMVLSYAGMWQVLYGVIFTIQWSALLAAGAIAIQLLAERRGGEMALLAGTLLLHTFAQIWTVQIVNWLGTADQFLRWGGFVVDPRTVAQLIFAVTAVTVLYRRHRREQERQGGVHRDLAQARLVQESLLTGREAAAPGFAVETAYLPASEVGGDFYQELAGPDGSLLVLVGDVSGKGMRAALLVGHISGALSNERSRQPAEVLANLNKSLLGRVSGGFVTCCCARFDADGTVTVANAGHLAPYAAGREVEVEAGLPLGVVGGAEYTESSLRLDGQFTLMSDGVVEAENAQRELFGFDRTRAISTKSAREIADAAKAWGQNDDITVVTVRRSR